MNAARFIVRSLRHYWRTHLCIVFGLAVAIAVITGSLLVGDSMAESLRHNALARIGNIDQVLIAPHFFRAALAHEIAAGSPFSGKADCSAAIVVSGSVQAVERMSRVPNVTVIGVDGDFWRLFPNATAPRLEKDAVAISQALANDLQIKPGDEILLSLSRSGPVPDSVLFAHRRREDTLHTLRLTVSAIVHDGRGGDFSMAAQSSAPRNLFMTREALAAALSQPASANAILVQTAETLQATQAALAHACMLVDYGLKLIPSLQGNCLALESSNLLLTPDQLTAARLAAADVRATAAPASVYLATRIAKAGGSASIAYSIVAALAHPPAWRLVTGRNPDTAPNAIALNSWAATDLAANVGDALDLTYLVPTADGLYHDATLRLTVSGVVELAGPAADPHLTPDLNGLTDAKRIEQWKLPFPIDHSRLTGRDEEYWNRYGATPKAFVSLRTMQSIWANASAEGQSGWMTSIRLLPQPNTDLAALARSAEAAILRHLRPETSQMVFRPVRQQLAEAAGGSTDFSQLFLAMSFFLVIAAGALAGMFMRLLAQQRAAETGIMLATGWRGLQVMRIAMAEASTLVAMAALIGLPSGLLYNLAILHALDRWWMGPWLGPMLVPHVTATALAGGAGAGAGIGLLCALWAIKDLRRVPVVQLLFGRQAVALATPTVQRRWSAVVPLAAAVVGLFFLGAAGARLVSAELGFFAGGACLLFAALAAIRAAFRWLLTGSGQVLSLPRLCLRNAAANRGRSLLTIGLLAAASFILVAVAANHRDYSNLDVTVRTSGAGGFSLRAATSAPLHFNLATKAGRANLGFSTAEEAAFAGVTVVPLSESHGDDVSCLNLNKPLRPRLLGVSRALIERDAFSITLAQPDPAGNPWQLLSRDPDADGTISALGDADSVEWTLHSGLGQIYSFSGADGKPVKLRIVGVIHGSIFAGELLISQENLRRIEPGSNGSNYFLLAVSVGREVLVADVLRSALADYGIEVRTTRELLNSFISVQNIYLSIFLTLGGLGLLLGTAGMVAVISRSVIERRGELALMSATGFTRARLVHLITIENAGLLVAGLFCGTATALLAAWPALHSAQTSVPWVGLITLLLAVTALGVVCCIMTARISIGAKPVQALREE